MVRGKPGRRRLILVPFSCSRLLIFNESLAYTNGSSPSGPFEYLMRRCQWWRWQHSLDCATGIALNAFHILIHLLLTTTLKGRCYFPTFEDGKTRDSLIKITELVNGGARICTLIVSSKAYILHHYLTLFVNTGIYFFFISSRDSQTSWGPPMDNLRVLVSKLRVFQLNGLQSPFFLLHFVGLYNDYRKQRKGSPFLPNCHCCFHLLSSDSMGFRSNPRNCFGILIPLHSSWELRES